MTPPLIVTLAIDDAAQERFDAERERLFPPGRAQVGAHVTLFHALPGALEPQVRADLGEVSGAAFPVRVAGIVALGRGVAYLLASPEVTRRHRVLQRLWWPHLTAQDQHGLRPHVTVQNKVEPAEARATLAVLRRSFRPYDVTAVGFELWRYDDGPWTHLARIPFAPPTAHSGGGTNSG
ncbi:MAG: hypothetical protein QOJ37_787 [Pseudonocardiales bacterium]|nr:hypothetical protein [Pseudonocardiales bacterium]